MITEMVIDNIVVDIELLIDRPNSPSWAEYNVLFNGSPVGIFSVMEFAYDYQVTYLCYPGISPDMEAAIETAFELPETIRWRVAPESTKSAVTRYGADSTAKFIIQDRDY